MKRTIKSIVAKKKSDEKITAISAYDYPFAKIVDEADIDIVLVGDSLGMVLLGYQSTVPVTMREMIHHTKAAARGVQSALLVGDMPFGSYDNSDKALINAKRFMKEGMADAIKLEGGEKVKGQVEAMIAAGIPVMGHLGMTPQTAGQLGGYKVQGKVKEEADQIVKDAVLLEKLGCFAIVLECVPNKLAEKITKKVKCPTIGIGAGAHTDGQILVLHDLLGFEGKVFPKFVRKYANLKDEVANAVTRYRDDVKSGSFPSAEESF